MTVKFSNSGKALITSTVYTDSQTVDVDDASVFPSIIDYGNDYFYVTFQNPSTGASEICKVTDVMGNKLFIERAQDGTTAGSFGAGDKCENRLNAGALIEAVNDFDITSQTDPKYLRSDVDNTTDKQLELIGTNHHPLRIRRTTDANAGIVFEKEDGEGAVLTRTYFGIGNANGELTVGDKADTLGVGNKIWHSGDFTNNATNWDAAYGWGDHADAGYLTTHQNVPTSLPADGGNSDTVDNKHAADFFLRANGDVTGDFDNYTESGNYYVSNWNPADGTPIANGPTYTFNTDETETAYGFGMLRVSNFKSSNSFIVQEYIAHQNDGIWMRVYWSNHGWSPWRQQYTNSSDSNTSGLNADTLDGQEGSYYTGYTDTATANSGNWDTAYGWGDHGDAGYLTSETHADAGYLTSETHASAGYLTAVPSKASPVTSKELGDIDLDDYAQPTDAGFYHQLSNSDADTEDNWPNGRAGSLLVQKGANSGNFGTTQLFIDYSQSNVYVRSMYGDGAADRDWKRLYTTSDFTNNSSDWNTAHGWGDHGDAGYLTDVPNHSAAKLTSGTLHNNRLNTDMVLQASAPRVRLNETGVTNTPDWWMVADGGNYSIRLNNSGAYPLTIETNADNNAVSKVKVGYNLEVNGDISADNFNNSNWDAAYGWGDHGDAGYLTSHQDISGKLDKTGGTLTGAVEIQQDGDALNLRSTTDGDAVRITFSSDFPVGQIGHIEYTHLNGESYGSGEAFIISGTESTRTILADGKLMFNEGIYSKPASGTGAGTRKDANWDAAYGWGDHGDAGYLTSETHASAGYLTSHQDISGKTDNSHAYKTVDTADATVGPGWITVAKNVSGRKHGEVIVCDKDSGDHAFIRIDFLRSYVDKDFTVLQHGGHANRITGVRILEETGDRTYGDCYLQVYVTKSSRYYVKVNQIGDHEFLNHTAVTPVVQDTISGYQVYGNELTGLTGISFACEESIKVGGKVVANNGDSDDWSEAHGWGDHADGGYLTSHQDISGKANKSGANFSGNVARVGTGGNATYNADTTVMSGYGLIGNRATFYITNSNANGAVQLGVGGAHNANSKLSITGALASFTVPISTSGAITASGNVTAYSDVRLKENIETLDGSKVYEMRGVSYTKDGEAGSGVIAQEMQKVAPELVSDDGEYLSVAYGNTIGYLIEAIKDLKAEVEDLKTKLEDKD